jgi:hypothetical protein
MKVSNRLPLTRAAKVVPNATDEASQKKPKKYSNLSPASKKFQKEHEAYIVEKAYIELLSLCRKNRGQKHGDIQTIVDKYKSHGQDFVE